MPATAYPNKTAQYAFLAKPPPPQKNRPTNPLPALPSAPSPPLVRRRSNTYAAINSWATNVQPGSPAPRSPCSPRRRPSGSSSRRPSLTRLARRPSISHSRAPSGSFVNLDTPSTKDFAVDLTALGYTSVFVHLPKTPSTPSQFLQTPALATKPPTPVFERPASASVAIFAHIPIPPIPASPPPRTIHKRFRSLSLLRTRSRSKSTSQMPPSPTKSAKAKAQISAASVVKRKKAKYAYMRPPPLANELALMQFVDGGNMESHVHRVMETQAKAAAGYGGAVGTSDVFRDGKGGLWWDQDEEWEYAHLLSGDQPLSTTIYNDDEEMQWVEFATSKDSVQAPATAALALATLAGDDDRRGSVSTQDSDLDPKYMVQPAEQDDALALFGNALASHAMRKPGMSVLALPSRPRRTALHLRKPAYILDLAAFGPRSPRSPSSAKFRPRSPTSSSGLSSPIVGSFTKVNKAARRRPAPLKLAPHGLATKRPSNSPVERERVKKDFMDDSFAPSPAPKPTRTPAYAPYPSPMPQSAGLHVPVQRKLVKKSSVMGLWRSVAGKKSD